MMTNSLRPNFAKEISSPDINLWHIYICKTCGNIFLYSHKRFTLESGKSSASRLIAIAERSEKATRTLLLQSWLWGRLCPPTRLCDGGTGVGFFWLMLRCVLSWTRSVSQALAPWGGANPASPLAGEGGPTKALGGNDGPVPDITGAPLPLPIRAPVSTFFGHDCVGHGHPWKAALHTKLMNYSVRLSAEA